MKPVADRRSSRLRPIRRLVPHALTLSCIAALVVTAAAPAPASAVADDDWLGIVNTYRAMSGLEPVTANGTWSAQAQAHSCYMLLNGISHDEVPGRPGYTTGGDTAGNSGNVAVSSSMSATARNHIDLWMTGPFHAIGILRHNLRSSGFGLCSATDAPTPWRSGGTLDVIRGIDGSAPRPASPIVFPGNGATVPLHSFITESPNPMTMCGWSGSAGLPLFAMMPGGVGAANAALTGPNGPIETCVLHAGNVSDPTARAILAGDNAVVVMPRAPLVDGTYTATVETDGGGSVTWSFAVDRTAPLSATPLTPPPPATPTGPATPPARFQPVAPFRFVDSRIGLGAVRLPGGVVTRIPVTADPSVVAVSANFVSTASSGAGYLSTYNCTTNLPEVSTLGYLPGSAVANQAFVPLSGGAMCLFSLVDTDVVVDINGYYHSDQGAGFTPITPTRLYDSRETGGRFAPGEERALTVTGVGPGAPAGSTAVALNLTAIHPDGPGFVKIHPCGATTSAEISSINFGPYEVRANTVVTPVAADGSICVQASTGLDVAIDLAGYFGAGGHDFQPLVPVRMFDSRFRTSDLNQVTNGQPVGAGQVVTLRVAGAQGIPSSAKAASVNITAVDSGQDTFVTAYPCGARPLASNVNITPAQRANANGAMVKLSSTGDLCLYTVNAVHLVVDINGVWV